MLKFLRTLLFRSPTQKLFADPRLETVVRKAVGKPRGALTRADVQGLVGLNASGKGIADLRGIEALTNLKTLRLFQNRISDITPLAGLTNLTTLRLFQNRISDVSPLAGLTNLTTLRLFQNRISDVTPLAGLTSLDMLDLRGNRIRDFSPVAGRKVVWR